MTLENKVSIKSNVAYSIVRRTDRYNLHLIMIPIYVQTIWYFLSSYCIASLRIQVTEKVWETLSCQIPRISADFPWKVIYLSHIKYNCEATMNNYVKCA